MSTVIIREVADSDINAIQSIYAYHVLNGLGTFEEVPPASDEIMNRLKVIVAANYPYLVAEFDGRVVGFCYANSYRQRSAYRFTLEDSVYIAEGYQGRQIGTLLLKSLVDKCKCLKIKHILAFIGGSDNYASINLHKRLGFTTNGSLSKVGFKFGQWVDVVIMQLEL